MVVGDDGNDAVQQGMVDLSNSNVDGEDDLDEGEDEVVEDVFDGGSDALLMLKSGRSIGG